MLAGVVKHISSPLDELQFVWCLSFSITEDHLYVEQTES